MGKHDEVGHRLHISKEAKFKHPRPGNAVVDRISTAPQNPPKGTNAQNQYR